MLLIPRQYNKPLQREKALPSTSSNVFFAKFQFRVLVLLPFRSTSDAETSNAIAMKTDNTIQWFIRQTQMSVKKLIDEVGKGKEDSTSCGNDDASLTSVYSVRHELRNSVKNESAPRTDYFLRMLMMIDCESLYHTFFWVSAITQSTYFPRIPTFGMFSNQGRVLVRFCS